MRADLRAAALAWYNAMGVIQMMKRMILAILALLLAAQGALAELPDSIQIVVGETYDFGEAISGAEGIASISGTALTGTAQGTGNVTSADDSCFVVVRDPNAIAYLYGISRLTTHYQGDSFALTGTIYSRYPIYEITVRVGDAAGDEILVSQTVNSEYRYPLANIDSQVMFGLLTPGEKRFTIDINTAMGSVNVWDVTFQVVEHAWTNLTKEQVEDAAALDAFFGNESYLFPYEWIDGELNVNPAWVEENIVDFSYLYGVTFPVHRQALPNFEAAMSAIRGSIVSITYQTGETRSCPLMDLVMYNLGDGAYNPRFTAGGEFNGIAMSPAMASAMSKVEVNGVRQYPEFRFGGQPERLAGTAIDINSALPVNRMSEENRQTIADAMARLSYAGEGFTGETRIYNFDYAGEPPANGAAVPDALKNCLLYEIAFEPAGFYWGYYFSEPCDPMHFTLTEIPQNPSVNLIP